MSKAWTRRLRARTVRLESKGLQRSKLRTATEAAVLRTARETAVLRRASVPADQMAAGRVGTSGFVQSPAKQGIVKLVKLVKKGVPSCSWETPGFNQTGDHPVVCVNWNDAIAYAEWLAKTTGQAYRLLSEAEAEYAVRGVTEVNAQPRYFFGNEDKDLCMYAHSANERVIAEFSFPSAVPCKEGYEFTAPVMKLKPNSFGLYDVHGNAWTWTRDCWNENYQNAPSDGSAWATGNCDRRVLRGGSWHDSPQLLRSASRNWNGAVIRSAVGGFRVARSLNY